MNDKRSTFQTAILFQGGYANADVEALPVEEQTILVETIDPLRKEQRRAELITEVKIAEQEYAAGNFNRVSAADFVADLEVTLSDESARIALK
jgi:hypothetical protein